MARVARPVADSSLAEELVMSAAVLFLNLDIIL